MKGEASENNRFLGTLSSSSIRNLLPRSKRKSKKFSENTPPPLHPNIQINDPPLSPSIPKLFPPSKSFSSSASLNRSDGQNVQSLSPRDPPPLLGQVDGSHGALEDLDPAVKVFVCFKLFFFCFVFGSLGLFIYLFIA
jgi:kinesin family protein 15